MSKMLFYNDLTFIRSPSRYLTDDFSNTSLWIISFIWKLPFECQMIKSCCCCSSVTQSHPTVTQWIAACQASLFFTVSWSFLKLMSIGLVMLSNHLILCHPHLVLPLIFSSIRVFQAPLSMEFFRQEYWCGLPFPTPGDLPNPGIEPASLVSPSLAGRFFTTGTI